MLQNYITERLEKLKNTFLRVLKKLKVYYPKKLKRRSLVGERTRLYIFGSKVLPNPGRSFTLESLHRGGFVTLKKIIVACFLKSNGTF